MKLFRWVQMTVIVMVSAIIIACGGGGGGGGGGGSAASGIGGTGVTSVGEITGFGSIFVNGIEFETGSSSLDLDDDSNAIESELELGMVVRVVGTINADGVTGTASSVLYDDDIEGPITTAITENADMTQKTFDIFDITVIADVNNTVYEGTDYASLTQNDVIEVSGFFDENGDLHATRIEDEGNLVLNTTVVEIEGTVSAVGVNQFNIGTVVISFNGSTDVSELPGGVVTNGQRVEVEGVVTTLGPPAAITASRIEEEDDSFSDGDNVEIEGIITDFVSNSDFKVNGQQVNAASASFEPSGLVLADGLEVEVEGTISGGVLIASEVESEDGEIKIAGPVTAVNNTQGTVTIEAVPGGATLTFTIDTGTSLEDDVMGQEPFNITDISTGDFLIIEAIDLSGTLVARELKRKTPEKLVLQGPVTSFDGGAQTVNILGVTIFTDGGTSYEDANDMSLMAAAFFAGLTVGDVVKMEDDDSNGIADELEYED